MCVPSRNGACDAIKSASALRLSPRLCVLRPDGDASASPEEVPLGCGAHNDCKTPATTRLSSLQNAGYSISVTNSPQLEQYNRVRGSSAKHATDGPKSRKLHYGELVGPTHVSPPNPRIKSQNPKGGFGALWRVFLRYLSSRKERYRRRRPSVK